MAPLSEELDGFSPAAWILLSELLEDPSGSFIIAPLTFSLGVIEKADMVIGDRVYIVGESPPKEWSQLP